VLGLNKLQQEEKVFRYLSEQGCSRGVRPSSFFTQRRFRERMIKPCLYSTRPHEREAPLIAHKPLQTNVAFILDALAVVLFCETTGGEL